MSDIRQYLVHLQRGGITGIVVFCGDYENIRTSMGAASSSDVRQLKWNSVCSINRGLLSSLEPDGQDPCDCSQEDPLSIDQCVG